MLSPAADEDTWPRGSHCPSPALLGYCAKPGLGTPRPRAALPLIGGRGSPRCGFACLPLAPPRVPEDQFCAGDTVVTKTVLALPLPSRLMVLVGRYTSLQRDQPEQLGLGWKAQGHPGSSRELGWEDVQKTDLKEGHSGAGFKLWSQVVLLRDLPVGGEGLRPSRRVCVPECDSVCETATVCERVGL